MPHPVSDADRKLWAMLAHLGGIILGFVAPLIVFLIYKDRDEFIKDQSTEALNFQITLVIGYVVIRRPDGGHSRPAVVPSLRRLGRQASCSRIIGGLAANRGERYRYPIALRLVK